MVFDKVILSAGCIFARTCDVLKEKRDASMVNLIAGAANEENVQVDASLHVSIIVNSAFASELFLKSMIPPTNIPKKYKGHDLEHLFNLLDDDNKAAIRDTVVHHLQRVNSKYTNAQFSEDLHNHRDAFSKWRYFYEGNAKPAGDFLLCFMSTTLAVAKVNPISV